MRRLCSCLVLALTASACGAPEPPRLGRLRFSDSVSLAALEHTDGFDSHFELNRVQFVHAHLDVSYGPGWRSRTVELVCVVTGPPSGTARRVTFRQTLPRGENTTTWSAALAAAGGGPWVEGTYQVRCEAAGSREIEGTFKIIDTASLGAPPGGMNALLDQLSPKTPPGPPATSWPSAPVPSAAKAADQAVSTLFDSIFDHTHTVPTVAPAAPGMPVTANLVLYATSERLGAAGPASDRFDAATVLYVGYELRVPDSTETHWSLGDCAFERVRTGVRLAASQSTTLSPGTGGLTRRGSSGAEYLGTWLPGEYRVSCNAQGLIVPAKTFTVEGTPQGDTRVTSTAVRLPLAEANVTSLQFLEFADVNPPPMQERRYFGRIRGTPKFIGAETHFTFKAADQPRSYTLTCHYFTAVGNLIGRARTIDTLPAGMSDRTVVVGWGHASGNYWSTGKYYVECDADGVYMASRFFDVERR